MGTFNKTRTALQTKTVECTGCNGAKDCHCHCLNFCEDCGMEKCRAHRELKWLPGSLQTEHAREYTEKKAPRDGGKYELPGKGYVDALGKFRAETTNKADFVPKKANLERPAPRNGLGPRIPFSGMSTYNRVHDGKKGPRSEQVSRPMDNYSAPFYGTSTNKADYTDKGDGRRDSCAPDLNILSVPFDGGSTYNTDFDKKKIPEKERRAKQGLLPSNNLDNHSTYGTDYVPLPFSKTNVGTCCADVRHTATRRDMTTL
eukprot:gene30519-35547_t